MGRGNNESSSLLYGGLVNHSTRRRRGHLVTSPRPRVDVASIVAPEPRFMETPSGIPFAVYGRGDLAAIEQLTRCLEAGSAVAGAMMGDHHVGYSMPIGGVAAYEFHISPTGVGYDIGCGVKGVRTNLLAADIDVAAMMDLIYEKISFGVGLKNGERVDHPVIDKIHEADFVGQRGLATMAADQLGTVGAGNHYVDLLVDDTDGSLWITCHFGSRGFGHKTATGFLSMANGGKFNEKSKDGEMHSPPVLLDTRTDLGQSYISAMQLAQDYAYAGREVVIDKVLGLLGAEATYEVQEHHNASWQEEHMGRKVWVVRKGATPAAPGQEGVIGGSMGSDTFVVSGLDSEESIPALRSTVHGAGRAMSRNEARGPKKWKWHWICPVKGCSTARRSDDETRPGAGFCIEHPTVESERKKRPVIIAKGKVDWDDVQQRLRNQGVHLRGGAADEAPEAYKQIEEVLAAHRGQIEIKHRLRPIGVAMAPGDEYDPWKD